MPLESAFRAFAVIERTDFMLELAFAVSYFRASFRSRILSEMYTRLRSCSCTTYDSHSM